MRHSYFHYVLIFAFVGGAALSPSPSCAQDSPWPDRAENLEVLPDTTGPAALRRTMKSFTSGLGVRCTHCHVGEEGQPLSSFDFPSDDKREKRVAREMLRMVGTINEIISGIDEPSDAEVTCFTCHRGHETPPEQLEVVISKILMEKDVSIAVARINELKEQFYGRGVYDFGPRTYRHVVTRLIEEGRYDDAITLLDRGALDYPNHFALQFYLSEAFLAKGDTTMARIYLEKAIVANPEAGFLRERLSAIATH